MPVYIKQTWVDGPGGGTPISAARLQHIEDGIAALESSLSGSYLQADPGPLTLSHGASAPSSPTTDQLWVDTGTVAGDFDVAGAAAAAQTAAIAASVPKTLFTAKGSLVAASLASTPTEVTVGADGTGLVADSTQTGGVAWKQRSRSVADVHTDGSVVNSTTNTVVATLAVPTTVAAGDILRAVFIGDMLNNTGSSVNYEWTLTLGATAALQTPVTAVTATSLRHPFRATCEILVVDPTSDQRLNVHSLFMGGTASTWALVSASPGTGRGTAAENLTAGKNLTLAVAMFTASASADFYCHEAYLEVIKR